MSGNITELFCLIDDFCNSVDKNFTEKLLPSGKKPTRMAGITYSEILTIILLYHQSKCDNFKIFYVHYSICYYYHTLSFQATLVTLAITKLVSYLNNPFVTTELDTGQHKEKYPLYADLIESQYEKAREKVKERFLHSGGALINYLSKHYKCNFDNMTPTEMEDFLEEHKNDPLDIMKDRELLSLESFINVSHLYSSPPLKTLALNQAIQNEKRREARELVIGCEKILQKAVLGQYLSEDITHKLAEKMIKSEVMSPEVKNFIRREGQKID